MTSRWEELRRRHRKILAWSIGAAVLIHVVVFAVFPRFRTKPTIAQRAAHSDHPDATPAQPVMLDVIFGPTTILLKDGGTATEPAEHVLRTHQLVRLPEDCPVLTRPDSILNGRVSLRVDSAGQAEVVKLTESTGDRCGDQMLIDMAGALLYRWIPNERYPAPLDVNQPVTLFAVDDD
jgi:hypothetical protein